jgi:hypothetical protein
MTEGVEFESQQAKEFSLLRVFKTNSEAYPAFYPMGTKGSFARGKTAGA